MPAGYYDEDDDYGQEPSSGPKGLRSKLDAVEKEKKALEAQLAELTSQNADLAKQLKSTTLRDALSDAGVDPKYARFAERDEVEPNADAVRRWAEENKDVYAFLNTPAPAPADGEQGEEQAPEDELPEDIVAGVRAGEQAVNTGRPSGSATITDTLAGADLSKFGSEAEVDAFIRSLDPPRRTD